jgi:hypothetical protein
VVVLDVGRTKGRLWTKILQVVRVNTNLGPNIKYIMYRNNIKKKNGFGLVDVGGGIDMEVVISTGTYNLKLHLYWMGLFRGGFENAQYSQLL